MTTVESHKDTKLIRLLEFLFTRIVKLFSRGWGLSRFKVVRSMYEFFYALVRRGSSVAKVGDFTMRLDYKDSLGLSVWGVYEEFETEVIKQRVKPGFVVIDVGAHIGYYTLIFSKLVGSDGRIVAFEPDPTNFTLLQENVQRNSCSNVALEQKALSDTNTKVKLYISKENTGDHRIYDTEDGRDSVEIKTVRLDDYIGNFQEGVDFIKMDIQGAEFKALQGMEKILDRKKDMQIVTEFWPGGLERAGDSPESVLLFLKQHNFSLYEINAPKKRLVPITSIRDFLSKCNTRKGNDANLLCVRGSV